MKPLTNPQLSSAIHNAEDTQQLEKIIQQNPERCMFDSHFNKVVNHKWHLLINREFNHTKNK